MQTSKVDHQLVALSSGFYRLLLAIYPKAFRQEYGPDMAQVFRDLSRRAFDHSGPSGVLGLWAFTLLDFAKTVTEEHLQKEAFMTKNTFIRLSGWALILGALTFTPFLLLESAGFSYPTVLETAVVGGFFYGPLLLSFGLLGLRARYGDIIGSLGKNILLIGAFAGMIVLVGNIGQEFQEDTFFAVFAAGLFIIFLCITLFGLIALRRNPLPRWNGLPLIAGIWIPALFSFSMLGITQIGNGQANWFFTLAVLITVLALLLLGYTLQSDAAQKELTPIQV